MNTIILDGLMISLLTMAIIFCWRLNGRLNNMRKMGQELKPFMKGFSSYIDQIGSYLGQLKDISEVGHKNLGQQIPQAARLKDDFDLFLEQGERLASRLEDVMTRAHQVEKQLQETLQRAKHQNIRTPSVSEDSSVSSHPFSTRDHPLTRDYGFDDNHHKAPISKAPPYFAQGREEAMDDDFAQPFDRTPYLNKKLRGIR